MEAQSGFLYRGRPLTKVLLELEERGLPVAFTSSVVTDEMTVLTEPTGDDLYEILGQILAEHGLAVEEGPRGVLVVVPNPDLRRTGTRVEGVVRSSLDNGPIAGASVRVDSSPESTLSASDGAFTVVVPAAEPFAIEVEAQGFLPRRVAGLTTRAIAGEPLDLRLDPLLVIEDQLVVAPSRLTLLREEPTRPLDVSRNEILALPHLGGDFFRALTLLPGAAANDLSAAFHVRGGRRDETQILLDGQELYEVYHLKDFDDALSVVSALVLESADLTTGGFAVQYGDRMAGVLEMTTVRPRGRTHGRVGLGIADAHVGGWGGFAEGRGSWLAEARRGSVDLIDSLVGDADPEYWDAIGKLDYRLGAKHSLRLNQLASGDTYDLVEIEVEEGLEKRLRTEYNSSYLWLTHQAIVGGRLLLESAASRSDIDRDRRGFEIDEGVEFTVVDKRDLDVLGLRQRWSLNPSPRHTLEWGWELRDFESEYDYTQETLFEDPLADIRDRPSEELFRFVDEFDDSHNSAYLGARLRLSEGLTLQPGLRFDSHTQTDEDLWSPRVNLAYAVGERTVVRAAWGRFLQSQRPYELQVEDDDTIFYPVEEAEHRVLGVETFLPDGSALAGTALRLELYRREVDNPRPRYDNLFEPFNNFPEVEPDRVRIEASRSIAEGVELFVRRPLTRRFGWWINYTYSTTEDELNGELVPRPFDQRHAVNVDLDFRLGAAWTLNCAFRYHSGWPTTPIDLAEEIDDDDGETSFVPVLGPLYSERLPAYHRLDLRATRRWQLTAGELSFYVDIQNVYDRQNLAGFDIEIDDEDGLLVKEEEPWAGILPSVGVSFRF